ncbi:hypothetical protein BSP36_150 [Bacillus phage BSP36]|uniref:Uncharacterized protein n=1 Tax=Bacillus phage BSP38 TaxID=2283013 RepID=A0A345MK14_BPBSP|nr:hypothetical protein HWB82_gp164 [Bacillus phage BSP38]AXH71196.1 hypothetical protein BSP38_154 [Bacillus phage BSP38]AYJ75237.1 hypothetical protein BSP36_150 [Bacillus phage BSP36]
MAKKSKPNSVSRSMSRGAGARGTSAIPNSGREAYTKSRQSTRGHYRIEFTQVYENMTEKDVELRKVYGVDLVAGNLGVPIDMITLKAKKKTAQTLTSLDEVFYVKVGQDTCGKLSIRTQRLWKGSILIFVFQKKKTAIKPPQKAFSRNKGYKKRTASQKSQASRNSYNKRRGGTR